MLKALSGACRSASGHKINSLCAAPIWVWKIMPWFSYATWKAKLDIFSFSGFKVVFGIVVGIFCAPENASAFINHLLGSRPFFVTIRHGKSFQSSIALKRSSLAFAGRLNWSHCRLLECADHQWDQSKFQRIEFLCFKNKPRGFIFKKEGRNKNDKGGYRPARF